MANPLIALQHPDQSGSDLEIRINFGMFAGREATPAEIDELARALRDDVPVFSIVAEQRHEFANDVEAAVHQVVIVVEQEQATVPLEVLCEKIVATGQAWADACIADRHVEIADS